MKRILMVCLGNICRSPVAEGVMQQLIDSKNMDAFVDSAGTSNYHIGEAPDPRSRANAKQNGVDISKLRGRQFTTADYDNFDLIFVMDSSNYENVIRLARNENDKQKVDLLLNKLFPGQDMSVPDPYYGGENGFQQVFDLCKNACEKIAGELESK